MAEHLVKMGLARAFGVYLETPGGKSGKDYQEYLRDLELLAAKQGLGAWAKQIGPNFRPSDSRREPKTKNCKLATRTSKSENRLQIDFNTAARDELMQIHGIGEVTANRIISERPYKSLEDLLNVEGIGPKSLEKLAPYFKTTAVN